MLCVRENEEGGGVSNNNNKKEGILWPLDQCGWPTFGIEEVMGNMMMFVLITRSPDGFGGGSGDDGRVA